MSTDRQKVNLHVIDINGNFPNSLEYNNYAYNTSYQLPLQ